MVATPNEEWTMRDGSAWVFVADRFLTRPVVLVGDAGTGLADLAASVDHGAYSLLAELRARGRDLILVGPAATGGLSARNSAVTDTLFGALAERAGSTPLMVGGTGRGALVARHTLAWMEREGIDHQTSVYFSYNGAAPTPEDEAELRRVGGLPVRPRTLRMSGGSAVADGLGDEDVDESVAGRAGEDGALLSKELGSWLLERLPD